MIRLMTDYLLCIYSNIQYVPLFVNTQQMGTFEKDIRGVSKLNPTIGGYQNGKV